MNYLKLKVFPLFLISLVLLNCEKDDICAEATATTPQLILRFYDQNAPEETKTVSSIVVYGFNDANEPVFFDNIGLSTSDSIIVPLRTDSEITRLVFHKDFDIDNNGTPNDDSDDIVLGNPDLLNISYKLEDIYVSRACGFKAIYTNLEISADSDPNPWISSHEIINTTVENQNSAHVKIFH